MPPPDLERILADTFADRRLSRGERRAFKAVLGDLQLSEDDRRHLRNRAFALAAEDLGPGPAGETLNWLHDVVKAIDSAVERSARPVTEAYFSPGEACRRRIVHFAAAARSTLDVCVFTITDDEITGELVAARRRGVALRVVTDDDKSGDRGSDVDRLLAAGVPVRTDRSDAHMHHKFAIADRRLLLTGSYNWTRSAAAENQENVIVTDARSAVDSYLEAFEELWDAFGRAG